MTVDESMTLDAFAELIAKDGYDIDDPAAAVTLAAYVVGPNMKRIEKFLGRPASWTSSVAKRLRGQGVWRGGRILTETGEMPDSIELAMQVAVAAGYVDLVDEGGRGD